MNLAQQLLYTIARCMLVTEQKADTRRGSPILRIYILCKPVWASSPISISVWAKAKIMGQFLAQIITIK